MKIKVTSTIIATLLFLTILSTMSSVTAQEKAFLNTFNEEVISENIPELDEQIPSNPFTGFCEAGPQGGNLEMEDIQIDNPFGEDDVWSPLEIIRIVVEVENDNNSLDIEDVITELGLFDSEGNNIAKNLDFLNEGGASIELGDIEGGEQEDAVFMFRIPAIFQDGNYKLAIKSYGDELGEDVECVDRSGDFSNEFYQEIEIDDEPNGLYDDPVLGFAYAPITIIEFGDFQDPFSQRFWEDTLPLIRENFINEDQVKYIFKDFPLTPFHPNAQKAAEASQCAHEQSNYWEYHYVLFANQDIWKELSPEDANEEFIEYADEISGIYLEGFENCLDSGVYSQEVMEDFEEGQNEGVNSPPWFFIRGYCGNEEIIPGAQSYSSFETAIENILSDCGEPVTDVTTSITISPEEPQLEDLVEATIKVQNLGNITTGVTYGTGFSGPSGGFGGTNCQFCLELGPGESLTSTLTISANQIGEYSFSTQATSAVPDINPKNNQATLSFFIGDSTNEDTFCLSGPQGGNLEITDFDLDNHGYGDENEWIPYDIIVFEVEVENVGKSDLEDITVEIGLFDENGDNKVDELYFLSSNEEKQDLGDLDDGDDDSVEFGFRVPADFPTGDYKLRAKAYSEEEGEENECTEIVESFPEETYYPIEIEYEDDGLVIIDNVEVFPQNVVCGEDAFIEFSAFNVGAFEQDQILVKVTGNALNLDKEIVFHDVESGDFARDISEFTVPHGTSEGTYPIKFRAFYNYFDGDYYSLAEEVIATLDVSECESTCTGDFNVDGKVNGADLAHLLTNWGENPGHEADLNNDNLVNGQDLSILQGYWGNC